MTTMKTQGNIWLFQTTQQILVELNLRDVALELLQQHAWLRVPVPRLQAAIPPPVSLVLGHLDQLTSAERHHLAGRDSVRLQTS